LAARHSCGERRSARRRNGSGGDRPRCRRVRACRRDGTRSSSRGRRHCPELRSNPPQERHRQHHRSMRPWVLKRLLETPRATPSRRDHPPRDHRWRRLHSEVHLTTAKWRQRYVQPFPRPATPSSIWVESGHRPTPARRTGTPPHRCRSTCTATSQWRNDQAHSGYDPALRAAGPPPAQYGSQC
jgi:hypothetical protein